MNIFISSIGRRVELVNILRHISNDIKIVAGDYRVTSAAMNIVDRKYKLPYSIDDSYMEEILRICKLENIDIVIPLIDTEIELYAKYKKIFNDNGILVNISSEKAIEISADKYKTYNFYKNYKSFKSPYTVLLKNFILDKFNTAESNVVLKPKNGSNSSGIYIIEKSKVASFSSLMNLDSEVYVVQEYIDFDFEVTTDIFISNSGEVKELCQRQRLKIRGGEVEQAKTIKDKKITNIILDMLDGLDFFGIINIQIMKKGDSYYIGEINPRFGGGFPLTFYAGSNLIEHLFATKEGKDINQYLMNRYKENFYMLRYDNAIYMTNEELNKGL